MRCTKEEIRAEVWGQLADHLDDELDERHVIAWFLDPAITFPNPTEAANLEPLLINTAGSWADRPGVTTRIPNLLLAADYVRTNTDLATMEGANEAARRAVNAILDRTRLEAPRCAVYTLPEPAVLRPARKLDELRWRLFHRPAKPPLRVAGGRRARAGGPALARRARRRVAHAAAGSLTRSRPASRQPASSARSPNASSGPSAPVPSTPSPAARRAAQARIPAVSEYGSPPERCTSASRSPAAS